MPLAGKYFVRSSVVDYIGSDKSNEKSQFAKTSALLGFMVIVHAQQAYLGYDSAESHIEHYQNINDPVDLLLTTLDSTYAFVNSAVAIRQASLMKRVAQIRAKKTEQLKVEATDDKYEKSKNPQRRLSRKGMLAAVAITLAGQSVFLLSYADSNIKESINECAVTSSEYYTNYSDEYPELDLMPEEDYIEAACAVN